MERYKEAIHKVKILALAELDDGLSIQGAKDVISICEKKEAYEACEGILQAVKIKEKEL